MSTPVAYMLVGLPGSGKSTWSAPLLANSDQYRLISSDAYIEQQAKIAGVTYGEAFDANIKAATANMEAELASAIANKKDIIWDQTNLNAKSRKPKVDKLRAAGYNVIAVAFEIPGGELARRREKRAQETAKTVPSRVIHSMVNSYQRPTTAEGFSEVMVISS